MTDYRAEDLAGWEFKILRSATNAFKNPGVMAAALADEARFGWELVEKFDDERLRLKRPISARAKDSNFNPGADPYRTQHGMGEGMLAVSVFIVIMLGLGIVIGAIYLLTS